MQKETAKLRARARARVWYRKNRKRGIERSKRWQACNPTLVKLYKKKHRNLRGKALQRARYRALKEAVLLHYGNKCNCCGISEAVFLDIDHVNGVGSKRYVGTSLFTRIIEKNFPADYQILCRNCNWAKYKGGCPHRHDYAREVATVVPLVAD